MLRLDSSTSLINHLDSSSNVVLLTNDRNLCSKAIISKIKALNYKSFKSKLDDLLNNVSHFSTAPGPITSSQSLNALTFQPIQSQPVSVLKRYSPTQLDSGAKPKSTFDRSSSMQDVPDHMDAVQETESVWKRFSPTQGMSSCLKPVDSITDKTLKEYLGHLVAILFISSYHFESINDQNVSFLKACLIEKQLRTVLFDFLCLYYRIEMEKAYGDLW